MYKATGGSGLLGDGIDVSIPAEILRELDSKIFGSIRAVNDTVMGGVVVDDGVSFSCDA